MKKKAQKSKKCAEAQSGQCLAGSLCGAHFSQRVMEKSIKVGLGRMEIGPDV